MTFQTFFWLRQKSKSYGNSLKSEDPLGSEIRNRFKMGIILLFGLLLGILSGLLGSTLLIIAAIFLTRMQLTTHIQVWRVFNPTMGLLTPLFLGFAYLFTRYRLVWDSSDGSGGTPDYSNWFQNLYVSGFVYTVAPGLAALFAFVAVLFLSPRK